MNSSITLQPQATSQKIFTILEDVTDTKRLGVLVGKRFIGFIHQDIDGGFCPIYSERGENLECGDVASMAETAACQLLNYRYELELNLRPQLLLTKDERKIPISYGTSAPPTEQSQLSGQPQATLVRGVSID